MIPINLPKIGQEEIDAVVAVMRSGMLTSGLGAGPKVREFESGFASFVGVKYAVAVNTGTAALHAALLAAGVGFGDEVVLPSFTFVATAEAAALAGARVVFADIDPASYTLSPSAVAKAITPRTRAIIPVDLYGLPADTKPIKELAAGRGIVVVEDCAQSHGAFYGGRAAGGFADVACWSLYAAKNMGTGEGGMVTTDDDTLAEKVRMVRTHGEKVKYRSLMLGTNYRMTEIQAAIGVVQLGRLPGFLARRAENAALLSSLLSGSEKLVLPPHFADRSGSGYLFTVRIKDATETSRNAIIEQMHNKGYGAEAYYPVPIHHMPYYQQTFGDFNLPETDLAARQVISLPIHPAVTEAQIRDMAQTFLALL